MGWVTLYKKGGTFILQKLVGHGTAHRWELADTAQATPIQWMGHWKWRRQGSGYILSSTFSFDKYYFVSVSTPFLHCSVNALISKNSILQSILCHIQKVLTIQAMPFIIRNSKLNSHLNYKDNFVRTTDMETDFTGLFIKLPRQRLHCPVKERRAALKQIKHSR